MRVGTVILEIVFHPDPIMLCVRVQRPLRTPSNGSGILFDCLGLVCIGVVGRLTTLIFHKFYHHAVRVGQRESK